MSIAGNSINTPFNPNKIKPSAEEIKEAVETALAEAKESGKFDGKDGINAHLTGKPVYGIHNADDIADLVNVLEDKETAVFARNLGDTFVAKTSDNALVTINKNSVYHIQFVRDTVQAIILVEQDNVEGMLVQFEDTVAGYTREVLLLNGLNAPQDGGTGGSGEYELINTVELTETGKNFYDIEITKDNEPFVLRAVTLFCTLPAMTKTAIDVLLKTKNNVLEYKSAHRRSSISNTDKQYYYRVSLKNEGYWTGSSVVVDGIGGTNPEQGSFARNTVQGDAVGIRIATGDSSIVFPEGTVIEVWGVKA